MKSEDTRATVAVATVLMLALALMYVARIALDIKDALVSCLR